MMASRNIKPALENTMPSLYINALKIEANNLGTLNQPWKTRCLLFT
jgi:hypothetical protein